MTTLDFLKLVWPTNGLYGILMPISGTNKVTGKPWKGFRQWNFPTIEAAAAHALTLANNAEPIDAYFALGSLKEDTAALTKEQRDAIGKKQRGVHKSGFDNTCALKVFWLDLDVKADPKAYATVQEAADALRGFVKAMGLPKPYVTSSGGGLHVYWPLSQEIDPDKWQHYANILKQLTVAWKLRADMTRTADRASVLRPVGTFNWKTGAPREVTTVLQGSVVDTNTFLGALAYQFDTQGLKPIQAQPAQFNIQGAPLVIAGTPLIPAVDVTAINSGAAAGAGYEQADPRKVVVRCRQLDWQAGNQAAVPEPSWYAMVGCLRHAKDGRRAVHFMSRQSPTYDKDATDAKITQHENAGYPPTTCQKFESENPGGCNGCPYHGKIKTPLQTVRELQEVAPPMLQLVSNTGTQSIALPPPPAPYKRVTNPMTGEARIAMTEGTEEGEIDVVIYENDIYPISLVYDEKAQTCDVIVRSYLPKDGWRDTQIPMGKFYDKRNLAITLGNAGVMPDLCHIESLVQYMIAYIRDLQKATKATTIFAQLGWRDDEQQFVLPDVIVAAGSVEPSAVSRNVMSSLDWVAPKGDLQVWKDAMAVYERPNMEAHQFGFGVGFASPLFTFTSYSGMVVSLVGKPGAGKSSAALSANSIWGHPRMGWGDAEHDTMKAFYNKLGILKNLPATYDEHTNLEPDVVSDMCYMVSKGRGRQRLMQNGDAAEQQNHWQLMMLMTGNASLNGRLAQAKADSSAESARIFEYTVPSHTLTKAEADAHWGAGGTVFHNYGLAGQMYAQHLVLNREWAKARVAWWIKEVDQLANVSSGERFWSAGVACVLTGFELSNGCGLTNVDVDRLLRFAVDTISGMRVTVQQNTRSSSNMVADYVNSNLGAILILDAPSTPSAPARVLNAPNGKLKGRLERDTGMLYIDKADFKRYCGRAKIDVQNIMTELASAGALRNETVRVTLGRGTQWSMTQSYCYEIDSRNPIMLGVGDMAAVPSTGPVTQLPPVTGHLSVVP